MADEVAAAASASNSRISLWQLLAHAELPARKCRFLWDQLNGLPDPEARLRNHPSLTPAERAKVSADSLAKLLEVERQGIRFVPEADYPEPLLQWEDRTPALFAIGQFDAALQPTVGIVGTRAATAYGRAAAYKFAQALAASGITVVSGGALGIDAQAHKGALEAGGKTIAVLSGGVDRVYPRVHAALFAEIAKSGCLVSQFAVGAMPEAYRFLVRNRLIAALSKVLLVVEAPERSGALSTASAANELGRTVFVAPANIDNQNFRGSHALIRDGAVLVDHPDQILEDIGVVKVTAAKPDPRVSPNASRILDVLSVDPLSAELISTRSGLTAAEVLSELTMLEMEGVVLRDGNGYAVRL